MVQRFAAMLLVLLLLVPTGGAWAAESDMARGADAAAASAADGARGEAAGGTIGSAADAATVATGEGGPLGAAGPIEGVPAFAEVDVVADGDVARMEGCSFAVEGFECSRTGSARDIEGKSYGYTYRLSGPDRVAVVNTREYAVLFVPRETAEAFSLANDGDGIEDLKALLAALDSNFSAGVAPLAEQDVWYVFAGTPGDGHDASLSVGGVTYTFGRELTEGHFYVTVEGPDEAFDVKAAVQPAQMASARLVAAEEATVAKAAGPLESLGAFLATMDYSPLWVTLRTCGVAIVLVFFLGLAAAYFTLRISRRAQSIFDTIFTIPMVLPPTVCGFLLLMALGRNTALGQFFQDVGFPLVFSWQATVIAAVVVAFPLMYRSARGAFESLDPNMLDAARTLGWSNGRIFMKLMLPLAWSSIASGTVLAFARALGEFGCTLFLAGNQLGTTRTIPIAIYFEWMNGNTEATWFWTIVLLVFSFAVILFINLWSRHTTRYRQQPRPDGRSPKPRRQGRRGGGRRSAEGGER